ncbi:MAG: spore coat associated protein CotJA [Clostridia bacterium]|nr:spore coat associated protein CotJA [Clostridia bacterium]
MNNRYGNRRHRVPVHENSGAARVKVTVPEGVNSLAMVYGISQRWRGINAGESGFCRGTIFDELDKPFFGDKCKR